MGTSPIQGEPMNAERQQPSEQAASDVRFRALPADPDPRRLRTEQDSRPDPGLDAAARQSFVERAQG